MDLSTDLQAGTAHLILHIILDQITGTTTPTTMIHTTDQDTIGITIETEDTNTTQDTKKEVTTTLTGSPDPTHANGTNKPCKAIPTPSISVRLDPIGIHSDTWEWVWDQFSSVTTASP